VTTPKLWTFSQLAGPRKTLTLSGWQAPFGRPRQGTVINTGLTMRKQVTYYPGDTPPTVHLFGKQLKSWDIHGRWMDAGIALKNGAKAYDRQWKDFVADGQEVRAKWGDILSYRIVIDDIDLNFESEAHIAWAMKAVARVDEAAPIVLEDTPARTPRGMAEDMAADLALTQPPEIRTGNILGILPDIADEIDSIISLINTPFTIVFDVASQLSDFESAISSDLVKMGSGLNEVRSGLGQLQNATDLLVSRASILCSPSFSNASFDGTDGLFSGPDMEALTSAKTLSDAAATNLEALIADMQLEIEKSSRGTVRTAYVAQDGDTWESIGTARLGGPDAGRAIRDLNGVRFGQRPIPGKQYSIPAGP
jgi:hypothetical protein